MAVVGWRFGCFMLEHTWIWFRPKILQVQTEVSPEAKCSCTPVFLWTLGSVVPSLFVHRPAFGFYEMVTGVLSLSGLIF